MQTIQRTYYCWNKWTANIPSCNCLCSSPQSCSLTLNQRVVNKLWWNTNTRLPARGAQRSSTEQALMMALWQGTKQVCHRIKQTVVWKGTSSLLLSPDSPPVPPSRLWNTWSSAKTLQQQCKSLCLGGKKPHAESVRAIYSKCRKQTNKQQTKKTVRQMLMSWMCCDHLV